MVKTTVRARFVNAVLTVEFPSTIAVEELGSRFEKVKVGQG